MGFLFNQQNAGATPKLTGIQVQTSAYGVSVPIGWGQNRTAGNLIDYDDFQQHSTPSGGGGKGGVVGGGGKGGPSTFTYSASVIIGLGRGAIAGVLGAWLNKARDTLSHAGFTQFLGTTSQSAWGVWTSNHPTKALTYRNLAYVAGSNISLGSSATLPNYTFEVKWAINSAIAGKPDADPRDILVDALGLVAFPSANIGDLTVYSQYCKAAGLVLSPLLRDQQDLASFLADMVELTNAAAVWSGSTLNVVPYGDQALSANGATYTPPAAPLFDLGDDDFLPNGDNDPVELSRKRPADQKNVVKLEILNRTQQYATDIADAKDDNAIQLFGELADTPRQAHMICDPAIGKTAATLLLQRQTIRNEYRFKLGVRYCVLDPMDIVSVTDANVGAAAQWVRLTQLDENDDGEIDVQAEEYAAGTGSAALYDFEPPTGYNVDYNIDPGNVNAPVILEPPDGLAGGLVLWVVATGGPDWGGCDVWISDDDATYQFAGRIDVGGRQGVLTAPLASASAGIDSTHTLSVDLTMSSGTLLSGTNDDAVLNNTLCYVDGELISYATATLTGAFAYDLTYLNRGPYSTTPSAHAAGTQFARLDGALLAIPFDVSRVGLTVYAKFVSFNKFQGGQQDISTLGAYSYTIMGSALSSPLPNPTNVALSYFANIIQINWTGITDFRTPIDYEIRKGSSFENGQVIGRTPLTSFGTNGDDTYWVSAHWISADGLNVYSSAPVSIVVTGSILQQNVKAAWDEKASIWSGSVSGGASVVATNIQVTGLTPGTYTIPVGHRVILAKATPCQVTINWTSVGDSTTADFLGTTDFLGASDFLGAAFGAQVSIQPQIRLSQNFGSSWGAWQNWVPGTYVANAFDVQVIVTAGRADIIAKLTQFAFKVSMPTQIDGANNVSIASGGTAIVYTQPYEVVPNVTVTILNEAVGDQTTFPVSPTVTGFTVQIKNATIGVARTINWSITQGY